MIVKNLNPLSLERKTGDQNKPKKIYMFWKECVPVVFYKYICSEEHFLYLNGKNVLYTKVSEIVLNFIEMVARNFTLLGNRLW